MFRNRQNRISCLIVLIFGLGLFYFGTDGFTAFTAETARVNHLKDEKPIFPKLTLEDSFGREYTIDEFKGKYVFITFLYTSCATVCPQLELNMSGVYQQIPPSYMGKDIVFLSISFDPTRDDPETLNRYKDAFHSDGETWRMARVPNEQDLQELLDNFRVIVIPDGEGNFAHNSAFYLVNPEGRLVNVLDYKKVDEAAVVVNKILDQKAGEQ